MSLSICFFPGCPFVHWCKFPESIIFCLPQSIRRSTVSISSRVAFLIITATKIKKKTRPCKFSYTHSATIVRLSCKQVLKIERICLYCPDDDLTFFERMWGIAKNKTLPIRGKTVTLWLRNRLICLRQNFPFIVPFEVKTRRTQHRDIQRNYSHDTGY